MAKRGRKSKKKIRLDLGLKLKKETIGSIFFILFLMLAILLTVSFLQTGELLSTVNIYLIDYFGLGSTLIPFLFLIFAFNFTKFKVPLRDPTVFLGYVILFISSLGLFKQGNVGQFIWNHTSSLFSSIPAFMIFLSSFVVGTVVLFDTSVVQIFKTIYSVLVIIKKYTLGLGSKQKKQVKQKKETEFIKDATVEDRKQEEKETLSKNTEITGIKPVLTPKSETQPLTSSINQTWQYPSLELFDNKSGAKADRGDVRKNAQTIEQTLESFGITARVAEINNSPSVTQYALEVALGTKLAKIVNLSNDLAMALAAPGGQIRVEAPIPGRSLVGIEVPNKSLEVVPLRKILESADLGQSKSKLMVPLGLGVAGEPLVANINKMPHVLVAGQTGSGKSVCINSWISTLLFRASPDEVRLILVDPKRVELTPYNGVPHLLTPVIVELDKVVSALKWAVDEMNRRYKLFAEVGARNIETYNNIAGFQSLPFIVIFIDELADIMLFSPSEVEDSICRIAQMARAVGIHLVLATQRPSVDILTGLIKANVPTRISFVVSSAVDSRVILDSVGAEKLLGRGDMLYIPPDKAKPHRIQGCFLSDKEIHNLIEFLKTQKTADYNDDVISQPIGGGSSNKNIVSIGGEDRDVMFDEAVELIRSTDKASASLLQRHLKLGYARAARLLDQLEAAHIIGPADGAKPRKILV